MNFLLQITDAIISFLFVLTLLFKCSPVKNEKDFDSLATSNIPRDTILVSTTTSHIARLKYPVNVVGKIRSVNRRSLLFEGSGIIEKINFKNGDLIEKGQVIAELRNQKEFLLKENARVALDKAQLEFKDARLSLRDSTYFKKEDWEEVKNNIQLNSGVKSAEIDLKLAEIAYEETILTAPISGIMEGLEVNQGDFVSPNTALARIYDPTEFEVECNVLEYDIGKLYKGMSASIVPLADSISFEGKVTMVNPAIDEHGVSNVTIKLSRTRNVLPGMAARVQINVLDKASIVIPKQAVVKRSERHIVFHVKKGLAKWNYVTLGKDNGTHVQILEGLEPGMEIIVSGSIQLDHDSPVRVE